MHCITFHYIIHISCFRKGFINFLELDKFIVFEAKFIRLLKIEKSFTNSTMKHSIYFHVVILYVYTYISIKYLLSVDTFKYLVLAFRYILKYLYSAVAVHCLNKRVDKFKHVPIICIEGRI